MTTRKDKDDDSGDLDDGQKTPTTQPSASTTQTTTTQTATTTSQQQQQHDPNHTQPNLHRDSSSSSASSSSQSLLLPHRVDDSLLEPFHYISSVPGKDVRGKLIDCFQLWFRVPDNNDDDVNNDNDNEKSASSSSSSVLNEIKQIVASLHNASLLVDDIEDNSKLRRGIPVAHAIFGIPTVLNCANYVYFLALEQCHKLSSIHNNAQAMQVFVGEILNLHRGQGQDIAWRENLQCPTEEQYLQMVRDKTGGLFRLAVGLLQAFATNSAHQEKDFTQLVNNLAVYFQIRDDYINLADMEYFKSKSFCEDLTEGKFSFPIIHCIRSQQQQNDNHNSSTSSCGDHRLLHILKQRTEDVEIKRYALRLLKEAGSFQYTQDKCKQLKQEIVADIAKFGGNPPLLKLIEVLDIQLEKLGSNSTNTTTDSGLGGGGGERGDSLVDASS